jgi:hypothetical protein
MAEDARPKAETRFDELKAAIHDYGEAAFQNLLRSRALATAILEGFHAYEGCPPDCVRAAPAGGAFDPHKDYGDAAFSFHGRDVIALEPVRFGLLLIVGNAEDSGALWLRTAISIEVAGAVFDVFVAAQPVIRTPLDFEGRLEPIFAALHKEFIETFTTEVDEFNDRSFRTGIGFMPDR